MAFSSSVYLYAALPPYWYTKTLSPQYHSVFNMSNNLYTLEDSTLSLWDAANILEYATSQFITIQLSLQQSHVTQTDAYHEQFVRHLVWEAEVCLYILVLRFQLPRCVTAVCVPVHQHMHGQSCQSLHANVSL